MSAVQPDTAPWGEPGWRIAELFGGGQGRCPDAPVPGNVRVPEGGWPVIVLGVQA